MRLIVIANEDVDYLIDELRKPMMVLTFAKGAMKTARAEKWIGAHKRAMNARHEIIAVLDKHGFRQDR
jgi:hypothetical protein